MANINEAFLYFTHPVAVVERFMPKVYRRWRSRRLLVASFEVQNAANESQDPVAKWLLEGRAKDLLERSQIIHVLPYSARSYRNRPNQK